MRVAASARVPFQTHGDHSGAPVPAIRAATPGTRPVLSRHVDTIQRDHRQQDPPLTVAFTSGCHGDVHGKGPQCLCLYIWSVLSSPLQVEPLH